MVNELMERYNKLESRDQSAVNAMIEAKGISLKEALEIQENDSYIWWSGVDSLEDLAAEMVFDGFFGEIPKGISTYIDYAAIGRDLELEGYIVTSRGIICIEYQHMTGREQYNNQGRFNPLWQR